MTSRKKSEMPDVLYAEASVRSIGGQSLFDTQSRITTNTVNQFHSNKKVVEQAVAKLEENGFEVLNVGDVTITIAAPPETYEKVFKTSIVPKECKVKGIPGKKSTTILDSSNSDIQGLINTDNSPLADVLEGVAINEQVFFFSLEDVREDTSENDVDDIPSAIPPEKEYYHLEPPDDLVKLLGAEWEQRNGVTGQGVKVVMVDTGFYEHPFFTKHNYHSNPVKLGPGASNPQHDEMGHGTGESVNIFSLAPKVNFTMVKMNNFNAVGAFNTAVELNPDIISCSWGRHIEGGILSSADKILESAVANAVRKGITVVFSAGNGGEAFPGMHPDVISAGGVYISEDGTMLATPYASGFQSKVYKNRRSPDICGLVGLPPRAAYIMFPVEPGDEIDVDLAGNTHPYGDETSPNDGWAAFSGTSAAAPQIAGICALLKQVNRHLVPQEIREILKKTARDITKGRSYQNPAYPGPDLATGYGLVNASQAVDEAQRLVKYRFFKKKT